MVYRHNGEEIEELDEGKIEELDEEEIGEIEEKEEEQTDDTEEEIERRQMEQEKRRESQRRSKRYTKDQRGKYYEWTKRFKSRSSEEVLPVYVPHGTYIIDQIFCTGDKKDTKGLYLVGWVHPNPAKSYKPSWQHPKDVPKEEIELYKKQGSITETQYDGLLDYLEDYGLLPEYEDDEEYEDSDVSEEI